MQNLSKLKCLIYVFAFLSMNLGISNAAERKLPSEDEVFAHCKKYNLCRSDWGSSVLDFANEMRLGLQKGTYGDAYGAPPLYFMSAFYFYNVLPELVDVRLLRDLFIQTPEARRKDLLELLNGTARYGSYQMLCERPGLKEWLFQLPYEAQLCLDTIEDGPLYCYPRDYFDKPDFFKPMLKALFGLFMQTAEDRRVDLLPSLRKTVDGSALAWLGEHPKLKELLFTLPYQQELEKKTDSSIMLSTQEIETSTGEAG